MIANNLRCDVPVKYLKKGEEPRHMSETFFSVSPKGGYDARAHNIIWEGQWSGYIIRITQEYHNSDITEDDIQVEATVVPDDSIGVYFPKKEIAHTLNSYINKIFA